MSQTKSRRVNSYLGLHWNFVSVQGCGRRDVGGLLVGQQIQMLGLPAWGEGHRHVLIIRNNLFVGIFRSAVRWTPIERRRKLDGHNVHE